MRVGMHVEPGCEPAPGAFGTLYSSRFSSSVSGKWISTSGVAKSRGERRSSGALLDECSSRSHHIGLPVGAIRFRLHVMRIETAH